MSGRFCFVFVFLALACIVAAQRPPPRQQQQVQRPNQRPQQRPNQRPQQRPNQRPQRRPNQRPQQRPNQRPQQRPQQYPQRNPQRNPQQRPQQRPQQNQRQRPRPLTLTQLAQLAAICEKQPKRCQAVLGNNQRFRVAGRISGTLTRQAMEELAPKTLALPTETPEKSEMLPEKELTSENEVLPAPDMPDSPSNDIDLSVSPKASESRSNKDVFLQRLLDRISEIESNNVQ